MHKWIAGVVVGLVLGAVGSAGAQGPYTAQIQRALAAFAANAHVTNLTVSGTCTGCGGGGGGTPGGANTQIQFNDGGAFGGNPNLTYDKVKQAAGSDYPMVIGVPESTVPATYRGWWTPSQTLFTSVSAASAGFDQAVAIESVTDGTGVATAGATGLGVLAAVNITTGNGGASSVFGAILEAETDGTQNVQDVESLRVGSTHNSSGTLATAYGIQVEPFQGASGGRVTNSYGMFLGGHTGTITNAYGIYLNDQTVAGSTLNYALFYAAPAAKTFSVAANGDVSIAGGLTLGGVAVKTPLRGVTGSIGGSLLAAGACTGGTATVTGATTSMAASASPVADPDPALSTGVVWDAFVSSANTVTVRVCGLAAVTPNATTYQVAVTP